MSSDVLENSKNNRLGITHIPEDDREMRGEWEGDEECCPPPLSTSWLHL